MTYYNLSRCIELTENLWAAGEKKSNSIFIYWRSLEDEVCKYWALITTTTPFVQFTREHFRDDTRRVSVNERSASAMDGRAVKAILFDLDNTLIETSRAGGVAIQKVIQHLMLM